MNRTFSVSASCWLAASALASTVLAGTPSQTCVAQECEIEDSSLLGLRRSSSLANIRRDDPSLTPAPDVGLAGGHKQAGDADDVQVWWLLTELSLARDACKRVEQLCPKGIVRKECLNLCYWMMGLHHVGIGFVNINTGHKSHAEFDATNFSIGMLNPEMNQSAFPHWSWKGREAATSFHEQWGDDGWKITSHVATIKGSDYNKIVSWISSDMKNNVTQYVLFSLATPTEAWPYVLPYVRQQHVPGQVVALDSNPGSRPPGSSTCMDAAALILHKIKEVAGLEAFEGDNLTQIVARNDVFQLMEPGTFVRKLDIESNKEDYNITYNYFSTIDKGMKMKSFPSKERAVLGLITTFAEMAFSGTQMVYTDINQDYWSFTPNKGVFAMYHESKVPAV